MERPELREHWIDRAHRSNQREQPEGEDRARGPPLGPSGTQVALRPRIACLPDTHAMWLSRRAARQRVVERRRPGRLPVEVHDRAGGAATNQDGLTAAGDEDGRDEESN